MYFVYAPKVGERFGDDPRSSIKYREDYNEYYAMHEDNQRAWVDAVQRSADTGIAHYVKQLMSWPFRMEFEIGEGRAFRPYRHNSGEARL
jgi:hypothetical protein